MLDVSDMFIYKQAWDRFLKYLCFLVFFCSNDKQGFIITGQSKCQCGPGLFVPHFCEQLFIITAIKDTNTPKL